MHKTFALILLIFAFVDAFRTGELIHTTRRKSNRNTVNE